jgi:cephalosporin hydroxylase
MNDFNDDVAARIAGNGRDEALHSSAKDFMRASIRSMYSYNFTALGRPVIQYPQDIVALQEIIWQVRPDVIVETGIAHGGSLILSASMLALLDYCDAAAAGTQVDPRAPKRRVVGVDIDIRAHNRAAIEAHPMSHRIKMIQGSSVDTNIVGQVHAEAAGCERVLVILDSNHTHDHVLAELEAYAPLTSPGSYCIVFDTVVEDLPGDLSPDRPWSPGNNPKTAVWEYLASLRASGRPAADGKALALEIDTTIENKLQITVAPDGYLKRPVA